MTIDPATMPSFQMPPEFAAIGSNSTTVDPMETTGDAMSSLPAPLAPLIRAYGASAMDSSYPSDVSGSGTGSESGGGSGGGSGPWTSESNGSSDSNGSGDDGYGGTYSWDDKTTWDDTWTWDNSGNSSWTTHSTEAYTFTDTGAGYSETLNWHSHDDGTGESHLHADGSGTSKSTDDGGGDDLADYNVTVGNDTLDEGYTDNNTYHSDGNSSWGVAVHRVGLLFANHDTILLQ